jgi:DNA helicase-2/ATP-dependent DNA helicase PcrA
LHFLFSKITKYLIILDNLQLSHQQQQIIDATEDNILVVACPGSGKTHTLISRYVKLILNDQYSSEEKDKIIITPDEVLLITFTKKAGMEMLNRLNKIVPNKLPYHVGSLHGLGYKVLQEYNDINYTILDEKDVREYLYDIINNNPTIQQLDIDELCIIKNKIQSIIDHASITYPFDLKLTLNKYNLSKYYKEFNNIYKLYQSKKKKEHLIDFNDLMIQFSKFLDDERSKWGAVIKKANVKIQ